MERNDNVLLKRVGLYLKRSELGRDEICIWRESFRTFTIGFPYC